jgi:hypothetical protein
LKDEAGDIDGLLRRATRGSAGVDLGDDPGRQLVRGNRTGRRFLRRDGTAAGHHHREQKDASEEGKHRRS